MARTREQKPKNKGEQPAEVKSPTRTYKPWLWLILLLVVGLTTCFYTFDHKLDTGGDNAAYYLLGKALIEGRGYVNLWTPGEPAETKYPPAYPLILGLVQALGGTFNAAKATNGAFFLGSLVFLYLFFLSIGRLKGANLMESSGDTGSRQRAGKRRIDRSVLPPVEVWRAAGLPVVVIACICIAMHVHLLRYATRMLSEIPYLFFSAVALYSITRINLLEKRVWTDRWMWIMIAGMMASYYTRSIGLALIFGICAGLAFQRAWRHVIVTGVSAIALALPWTIRSSIVGDNRYVSAVLLVDPYDPDQGVLTLALFIKRVMSNIVRYMTIEIPQGTFPVLEYALPKTTILPWIAGVFIVVLVLIGLWRTPGWRGLLGAYLAGTFAITLVWPEIWTGTRFIVGIIPILVFLALFGLYELIRMAVARLGQGFFASGFIVAPIVLFWFYPVQQWHLYAETPYPPRVANYFQMAQWAGANLPEDAIVVCSKPSLFYLFANRQTIQFALTEKTDEAIRALDTAGADYVVIDQVLLDNTGYPLAATYLVPAIEANPGRFEVINRLQNPDTYLLRYLSGPVPVSPTRKNP